MPYPDLSDAFFWYQLSQFLSNPSRLSIWSMVKAKLFQLISLFGTIYVSLAFTLTYGIYSTRMGHVFSA